MTSIIKLDLDSIRSSLKVQFDLICAQFIEDQTLNQDLILESHGSWLWVAFRNVFLTLEKV